MTKTGSDSERRCKKEDYNLIKDSVRRLFTVKQEKKKFDEYYEQVKRKEQLIISNFIYSCLPKEKQKFSILLDEGEEYYSNHKRVNVVPVRQKKVIWDIEKLKGALSRDIQSEVIEKEYRVNDMSGLVKYLKECGVNPKIFKSFIDVSESVNTGRIDELSEIGEIVKKDIEGCYTVELSDPYIKLTEVRGQEDEKKI